MGRSNAYKPIDLEVVLAQDRVQAARQLTSAAHDSVALERLTANVARIIGAECALLTLLTDEQLIAQSYGTDVLPGGMRMPLVESFCAVVVTNAQTMVIDDAVADPRLSLLPVVNMGEIGSYMGTPLSVRGEMVGALCAYDRTTRRWSDRDVAVLEDLAKSVAASLDVAALLDSMSHNRDRLALALMASDIGSWDWDLVTDEITLDARTIELFGYDTLEEAATGALWRSRIHPDDYRYVTEAVERAVSNCDRYSAEYRVVLPKGGIRWVEARGKALCDTDGRAVRLLGGIFDVDVRHHAEVQLRMNAQRQAVLASAGERLSATLDERQVLQTLGELLVPRLGDWMVVALVGDDEDDRHALDAVPVHGRSHTDFRFAFVMHRDIQKTGALRHYVESIPLKIGDRFGVGHVVAEGETEYVSARDAALLGFFGLESTDEFLVPPESKGGLLTVPLKWRGKTFGAVTVGEPSDDEADRELIEDIIRRGANALDNAMAYGMERRVALTLQRELLPTDVPHFRSGVHVEAKYLPAISGTEIGGDFYSAHELDDGTVVLVIGDVMGKGMGAAARMAQLRAIASSYAVTGACPSEVLTQLAASSHLVAGLDWATVCVVRYDPATRQLNVASAGHFPPMVIGRHGSSFLDVESGPPIGVGLDGYKEIDTELAEGCTLLLYTDGLVERRGEAVDVGMEQMARSVSRQVGDTAVFATVLEALGRSNGGDDDIALMLLTDG